jgi:predicted O-linked N-acetylglucosamine transferase (SPINDLY family)
MNATEQMLAAAIRVHNTGQLREAEMRYRKILMRNPRHPGALNGLGVALYAMGRLDEAWACLEQTSRAVPGAPEPYNNLGLVAAARGRTKEAIALYQRAVDIAPEYRDALGNLATALLREGKPKESIPYFERVLRLDPRSCAMHNNYARALNKERRLEECIEHYQIALEIDPHDPRVLAGIAGALWPQGRTQECIDHYRRAVQLDPTQASVHSSLLFYLNYSPEISPQEIFEEHLRWGARHADPLTAGARPHSNIPDPDRRLRVGYVSADFLRHVVNGYFTPVLAAHTRQQVEVFCYANVEQRDATTLRTKNRADAWRDVWGMDDDKLADLIREDRIDILVDLNGHTSSHRLLAFARKPAPVQVSWIGYVNTTGMRAMDYRIVDPLSSPPGDADRLSTEELVRPPVGTPYFPPDYCPAVGPLPATRNGYVTFGSSNNPGKLSDPAVETWAKVLAGMTGARLQLNYPSYFHASTREQTATRFARHGIAPERIDLLHTSHEGNLASYNNVDISLDTFPFNGSTTSLESLWMGVPVVTLAGQTVVSRIGVAVLAPIGLSDLVARSTDEYVETAVALANDRQRLERLRGELRNRMVNSPLTDVGGFTAALEAAYRRMWRRWCAVAAGDGILGAAATISS